MTHIPEDVGIPDGISKFCPPDLMNLVSSIRPVGYLASQARSVRNPIVYHMRWEETP